MFLFALPTIDKRQTHMCARTAAHTLIHMHAAATLGSIMRCTRQTLNMALVSLRSLHLRMCFVSLGGISANGRVTHKHAATCARLLIDARTQQRAGDARLVSKYGHLVISSQLKPSRRHSIGRSVALQLTRSRRSTTDYS